MSYRYIHLGYLNLMAGGEQDTRRQLLNMLIADLESSVPRMRALWKTGDIRNLQQISHHLKSTFPFAGNEQMANANRQLDQQLKAGQSLPAVAGYLEEIEALLPRVLAELRQELRKI